MKNLPINNWFLDTSKKITNEYDTLCGKSTTSDRLFHIVSEVSEVGDVLRNKKHKHGLPHSEEYKEKLLDEVADIFLTTTSLVDFLGISNNDINKALEKKLIIVGERVMEFKRDRKK